MKKIINAFLFVGMMFSMTACFDITEDVTVNKDGSGVFTSIMDATKLSEQLAVYASFDTTGQMIPKMKYSLDSTFAQNFKKYRQIKGISNVKVDTSKEYVYKVTVDFKDFTALNDVINVDKKDSKDKNIYAWEKGKVSRKDIASGLDGLGMEDESQKEMLKQILKDMKYKIIFRVPQAVKNMTNKVATLSSDKKTVTLQCNLLDVMEAKTKLGNEVKYKN